MVNMKPWNGDDLKDWRKRMDMTQKEAGVELGVTKYTFMKWENNQQPIRRDTQLACLMLARESIDKTLKDWRNTYIAVYGEDNWTGFMVDENGWPLPWDNAADGYDPGLSFAGQIAKAMGVSLDTFYTMWLASGEQMI